MLAVIPLPFSALIPLNILGYNPPFKLLVPLYSVFLCSSQILKGLQVHLYERDEPNLERKIIIFFFISFIIC